MHVVPSFGFAGGFQLRAELLGRVRTFFAQREFLEVETPILSADVTVDRHLDPLSTVLADDPRRSEVGQRLWLQTSPEFGMKRLLAAGATAIFQITRAFRGGEIGPLHNPEFTMVEWYRVGDDMAAGMTLLSELCSALLGTPAAERSSYAAAFERFAGIDPHGASLDQLSAAAARLKIAVPAGLANDRDGWLNLLLAECVQRQLGQTAPTILYDYPASQAALAGVRSGTPPVAERFELYVRGIELANGYHELLDAAEFAAATLPPTRPARPKANSRCRKKADCWKPWTRACRHAPAWRLVSIASSCLPPAQNRWPK